MQRLLHFTYYFPAIYHYLLIIADLQVGIVAVHGFQQQQEITNFHSRTTRTAIIPDDNNNNNNSNNAVPLLFSSFFSDGIYNEKFIIAASKKLGWEINEETSQKPLLVLSSRDNSPEDYPVDDDVIKDTSDWDQSQRWKVTVENLSNLGVQNITSTRQESHILENCPQLFRLETAIVQETAKWIIDEFGIQYLQTSVLIDNPIILSYKKEDFIYGLKFMSTMMMMDAKPACIASSTLLLQATQGGIQERLVSAALGAASVATSKATKSIASDTMESLRKLRSTNRNKR